MALYIVLYQVLWYLPLWCSFSRLLRPFRSFLVLYPFLHKICEIYHWYLHKNFIESIDGFGYYGSFNDVNFSNWWTCWWLHLFVSSSFFTVFYTLKTFFIVIQWQLPAFSPHPSIPSQPIPPPFPTSTFPLDFVLVSFIVAPIDPSPISSSPLPSGYCYIVFNFNVSGYILFAFFLLLIRFQLKVRSYAICPSPPGLFHLA